MKIGVLNNFVLFFIGNEMELWCWEIVNVDVFDLGLVSEYLEFVMVVVSVVLILVLFLCIKSVGRKES